MPALCGHPIDRWQGHKTQEYIKRRKQRQVAHTNLGVSENGRFTTKLAMIFMWKTMINQYQGNLGDLILAGSTLFSDFLQGIEITSK